MCIEFVEKIDELVIMQGRSTHDDVPLCLGSMPAVRTTLLLPFNHHVCNLFQLRRENDGEPMRPHSTIHILIIIVFTLKMFEINKTTNIFCTFFANAASHIYVTLDYHSVRRLGC